MAGLLTRIYQLGAKVEANPGVAEALVAADFSNNTKDVSSTRQLARYDRGVARPGLSTPKAIVGGKYGSIAGMLEMTGGGAAVSSRAMWHDLLRGCGTSFVAVRMLTFGAALATALTPGTLLSNNATFSSATKTGVVLGTNSARTRAWVAVLSGTFADTDALFRHATPTTSGTSLGQTVSGAPAEGGKVFTLVSETASQDPASCTVEYRDSETVDRLVGARGNAEIMCNWGEVPLLSVTFEGPLVNQNIDGTPVRAGLVSGTTFPPAPSFLLGDRGFPLVMGGYSPIVESFRLSLGNTITQRRTISDGGTTSYIDSSIKGGYAASRITGRNVTITIDPEKSLAADFDFCKTWQGNTEFVLGFQAGTLDASGDQAIAVVSRRTTIDGDSMADTDRNGTRSLGLTLKCNGDNDDEVLIAQLVVP